MSLWTVTYSAPIRSTPSYNLIEFFTIVTLCLFMLTKCFYFFNDVCNYRVFFYMFVESFLKRKNTDSVV